MKYYTKYLPYLIGDDYDRSYPSPEKELLWRLDELEERMEELVAEKAPYRRSRIYSDDDIRYALPQDLDDVNKVERAIEFAKDDLVNKYGLPSPDELFVSESGAEQKNATRLESLTLIAAFPDRQRKAS